MGESVTLRLILFDQWRLIDRGSAIYLPPRSQRLLALLALQGRQNRARLAGTLWPDVDERRALASLRAAVADIGRRLPRLLAKAHGDIWLRDGVAVDVDEFRWQATELLSGRLGQLPTWTDRPALIGGELLPGWYDDWVFVERERIHQLRLHVLEAYAEALIERGAYAQALHVALEAVATDPLRESARRCVIKVHLAEGNTAEAIREYNRFRDLLREELGVSPTHHVAELVRRGIDVPSASRRIPRSDAEVRRPA